MLTITFEAPPYPEKSLTMLPGDKVKNDIQGPAADREDNTWKDGGRTAKATAGGPLAMRMYHSR